MERQQQSRKAKSIQWSSVDSDYDFLFDKGYITFKNNGEGIISQRLSPFARKVFDVSDDLQLRNVFSENKEYLDFHRSEVFE